MKGFIVYPTYSNIEGQTYVQLFGKLENGESFVTINKLNPYLFIKKLDFKKVKKLLSKYSHSKTDLKNFNDEEVVKIEAKSYPDLTKLKKAIHKMDLDTYEADIKPHYRFMIDNDLLGTIEIKGESEPSEKVDKVFKEPEVKNSDYIPKLKIASIDIESNKDISDLFCIGIYSENYEKNFMITTNKKLKDVVPCKDERECLEKFKQAIIELDPDIITGWHMIDFDLKYLKEKFEEHNIRFDLGRTNETTRLKIESNYFRPSKAKMPGRLVLDALNLIKDPYIKEAPKIKNTEFESYALESVSQAFLGKGKIISSKDRHKEIEQLFKEDQQKLAKYNLMDCELAYRILEETEMIELAIERSQLTGMPLDRITASIASFDSLYIREARKRNLVSPTTHYSTKKERIKGGYVMEADPGIYDNVLVLDFKSLYPSIIRTFNIDPASFLPEEKKGCIKAPNNACFKNQEGILPDIIKKLHKARELAKKEKREFSTYAIKIIMNSFFGVLASPNCRYFSLDMANAITHFGQFLIKLTAKEVEKMGYDVIYSDTDSVFVETNLPKEKANKLGLEIQNKINSFYDKYVQDNFNRKSFLELEFEKQYLHLMIPKIRSGQSVGAKKRYAGLIEKEGKEKLQIIGMEAIRGDWTEAAQDFQKELIIKAFNKEPIGEFIRDYINKIRDGKLDRKLIYRKSIRKNLEKYTKTTPPHVKAARKLDKLDSNLIQYYITTDGPEPIQKLQHQIDYEHYIEKQIKPIANQVLILTGKNFDDTLKKSKQSTLF